MSNLKGSKTEQSLKDAFGGESMANRRYLYFAQKADVEGYNDVAAVFRSTAEGETGHAHGQARNPLFELPDRGRGINQGMARGRVRARFVLQCDLRALQSRAEVIGLLLLLIELRRAVVQLSLERGLGLGDPRIGFFV